MVTQEDLDKVKDIFAETLNERFAGELVFDPIVVKPEVSHYDDDYLRIFIVFDGDQKKLDPSWTVGLIRRVRTRMEAEGIVDFPSPSFVKKSDWLSAVRRGKADDIA